MSCTPPTPPSPNTLQKLGPSVPSWAMGSGPICSVQTHQTLGSRALFVPLVEGLLGLLHGLEDAQEILVAEGVDRLGLVELLGGAPVVLEPGIQDAGVAFNISPSSRIAKMASC